MAVTPEALLPHALAWVRTCRGLAMDSGSPLADFTIAYAAGVTKPSLVKVLKVKSLPVPGSLLPVALQLGFGSEAGGLAAGYGVLVTRPEDDLLAHELAHVAQMERFGGVKPWLLTYLRQILSFGYEEAPLEKEAREFGNSYVVSNR